MEVQKTVCGNWLRGWEMNEVGDLRPTLHTVGSLVDCPTPGPFSPTPGPERGGCVLLWPNRAPQGVTGTKAGEGGCPGTPLNPRGGVRG